MNGFLRAQKEGRTLIIGHRGCTIARPENTMAAFRYALESGAHGLETDLHATKDGRIVLMHDNRLERTTNGTGLIENTTFEEIRRLSAGARFSPEYESERVPEFIELLNLVRGRQDFLLNIEFKDYPEELGDIAYATADRIMEIIEREGFSERVLLNTFSGALARYLHDVYPEYPIHTFFPEKCMRTPGDDIYDFSTWVCTFNWGRQGLFVPREETDMLISRGCGVCVCVPRDTEETFREAYSRGNRMFTCNEPREAMTIFEAIKETL